MTNGRTALVIDDDADIRELLCAMLETAGFRVDALSDGIDAVDLKKAYDVILLDLNMPVFDGRRLTDYWQLTAPEVLRRVIVLTGYSRLEMAEQPSTFARLAKPFDFPTLMKVVEECIAQSEPLVATGGSNV